MMTEAGVPLDDFQGYGDEIKGLPGKYHPSKHGALLLAVARPPHGDTPASTPSASDSSTPTASSSSTSAGDSLDASGRHCDVAGCIALKDLGGGTGEIKRLFIRPEYRRKGLAKLLVTAILQAAMAMPADPEPKPLVPSCARSSAGAGAMVSPPAAASGSTTLTVSASASASASVPSSRLPPKQSLWTSRKAAEVNHQPEGMPPWPSQWQWLVEARAALALVRRDHAINRSGSDLHDCHAH